MQSKIASNQDGRANISVEFDTKELLNAKKQAINELRGEVEVKGFRKGSAPDEVVQREVGEEHINKETIELVAAKAYPQLIKEHKLRALGNPHVEIKKFVPMASLELVFSINVMPEVRLPDYKKIKKQNPKIEVTAKEVNDVIEGLRQRAAERSLVNRNSKTGDEIVINMQGTHQGKPVPGTDAKDYTVFIGSNRFVPGFEENLVGLKAGDNKKFKVTFPKNYPETWLQNKQVEFSVEVKSVKGVKLPDIDNKLAAKIGPFKDLDELKKDVEKQLHIEKEQAARRNLTDEIVSEVIDGSTLSPPADLVEHQFKHLWADFEQNINKRGQQLDEYLKEVNKNREEVEGMLKKEAAHRVKTALVLSEIAKKEGITVSPEELEIRMQVLRGRYQDDKIGEQLERPEAKGEIKDQILIEKTVGKLVEYATK